MGLRLQIAVHPPGKLRKTEFGPRPLVAKAQTFISLAFIQKLESKNAAKPAQMGPVSSVGVFRVQLQAREALIPAALDVLEQAQRRLERFFVQL